MNFPVITQINDVLPVIIDAKEFVVLDKGDYLVADYVYRLSHTFDHPIARECRGLKFHADGRLLARPFHKFFNVGEREAGEVGWSDPNLTIEDKWDGSMVHAAWLQNQIVFMTRKGRTDVAIRAEPIFLPKYADRIRLALQYNVTPIFEFVGPSNPHVVPYAEDDLVLLAARYNYSGNYIDIHSNYAANFLHGCHVVKQHYFHDTSMDEFLRYAYSHPTDEGFVIKTKDEWFKVKASQYVLRHRAKSDFDSKEKMLELVLNEAADDLYPLLQPWQQEKLKRFEDQVLRLWVGTSLEIGDLVFNHEHLTRKEFALGPVSELNAWQKPIAFSILDGKEPLECTKIAMIKNVDKLGLEW